MSGSKRAKSSSLIRPLVGSAKKSDSLLTISASEFAKRFASGIRISQQSFTWFLGAGCSKTSGIPDAGGLVEKWLAEQHELEAPVGKKFESWVKGAFPAYDPQNPATLYAAAFARRHPSPVERQREIELICSRGQPAYGYATLAQLLSHKEYGRFSNTILTTNFDDLIADALYLYGELHARLLVVTHEALARYVRTNSPRPTVVKLHGDAHLDPKNLQPETREIDEVLARQLYPFLQDHALIFLGYGGNDLSILKFVQNCPIPPLAPPIFWVSKREPQSPFLDWLRERGALRVDLTDFDQLMHLIRDAVGIELLDRKRWSQIGDVYYEAFERLRKEIEGAPDETEDSKALRIATSAVEKSLPDDWSFYRQAEQQEKIDPQKADEIYQEGLQQFPESATLHGMYAEFLKSQGKDFAEIEKHFKRAVEIAPNSATHLSSYAIFLEQNRKDMDRAESYYKRAIEVDPKNNNVLVFYADFLDKYRNELDKAEAYYKRALEVDPDSAYALKLYADFLKRRRGDIDGAESYYKRALASEPNYVLALLNYADLLENDRGDAGAAELNYRRAIEANPSDAYGAVRYANFLLGARNDMDAAEAYYKRAIELEPDDWYALGKYAFFLESIRKDSDAAKRYRKRAERARKSMETS